MKTVRSPLKKSLKKPENGNTSQGNSTGCPVARVPEKSAGLVNKDQPKKVEEVHPNQTKSPANHALNLESNLQGSGHLRTQAAFNLCQEFEKKGGQTLN